MLQKSLSEIITLLQQQQQLQSQFNEVVLESLLASLLALVETDSELDVKNRTEAGKLGAIKIILSLLTLPTVTSNVKLLQLCLATLRFVTKGVFSNIVAATNNGAIRLVIEIMRQNANKPAIQQYCCMVFRSLTFQHAENQRYVVSQGGMTLIVQAMRLHRFDAQLQAAACMAIQNLTWLVGENRRLVLEEGAILLILDAIRTFPKDIDVARWACGAFQNLACCDLCIAQIMHCGALPIIVQVMSNFPLDAPLQNYVLGVCRNLSFLDSNRTIVATSGVLPLALNTIKYHSKNNDLMLNVCCFFINTVSNTPSNTQLILELPNVLELLFVLKSTMKTCTSVLSKLSQFLDLLATPHRYIIEPVRSTTPSSLVKFSASAVLNSHCECKTTPQLYIKDVLSSSPNSVGMYLPVTASAAAATTTTTPTPTPTATTITTNNAILPFSSPPTSPFSLGMSLSSVLPFLNSTTYHGLPSSSSSNDNMNHNHSSNDGALFQDASNLLPLELVQYLSSAYECSCCGKHFFETKHNMAVHFGTSGLRSTVAMIRSVSNSSHSTGFDWYLLNLCSSKCVDYVAVNMDRLYLTNTTTASVNHGEH